MTREDEPRAGLLLVDKPEGKTSHDVVAWARRRLGTRRVGHAGTLDPFATGLLPCLVGPATRLAQYLQSWAKTYVGVIALGLESPTGDVEGVDPASRPEPPLPGPVVLQAAAERLSGSYLQAPPAFSAKKVGGVRSHRLARRGFEVPLEPVRITVHRLRLVPAEGARLLFAAEVSSGTYIRGLARDLGRILGTGAYLESLRRTGVGPLRVRGAVRPTPGEEGIDREPLLSPLASIPLRLPDVALDDAGARSFGAGRPVPGPEGALSGLVRALGPGRWLAGIGEIDAGGWLAPRTVLAPSPPGPGLPGEGGRWSVAGPAGRW